MVRSAIKSIIRYLKIYGLWFKMSLVEFTTYRISFFIGMAVEIGYQVSSVVFFMIIFGNVNEIAGWSYEEIMFLTGLDIVTSEVVLGSFSIFNLRRLPEKIKNGDLDVELLKPINSLFNLSVSKPYVASILSTFTGVFLMFWFGVRSGASISIVQIIAGVLIIICGVMLAYSIIVILSSFTFVFVNNDRLPYLGEKIVFFKESPHHVFRGPFKVIFFYILPVVFMASVPTTTILRGVDWGYLGLAFVLAGVFLTIAVLTWNRMIKFYTSASS